MPATIPEKFKDLLEKPAFANLATIMPDGSPQVTPVWFDYDGNHILVNSALGRVKDRNMRRNPLVALSIMDPANPYRYMEVRGQVTEITQEGADQLIDKLAKKYMNVEKYPYRSPDEVRVIFKISPTKVSGLG
jgi:PPOX class probable F420-dependent enzyme